MQKHLRKGLCSLALTLSLFALCSCSKDNVTDDNTTANSTNTASTTLSPPQWMWGVWENKAYEYTLNAGSNDLTLQMSSLLVYVLDPNGSNAVYGVQLVAEKEKTSARYELLFGGKSWYTFTKLSATQLRCTIGGTSVALNKK